MEAALDNARRAQVERVLLTHHDPTHRDAFRLAYLADLPADARDPRRELARQGVWYDV
jgi:phosphoribosyl 1,2-cyclic phosphodiesterase